jgi:hypothetical protein
MPGPVKAHLLSKGVGENTQSLAQAREMRQRYIRQSKAVGS